MESGTRASRQLELFALSRPAALVLGAPKRLPILCGVYPLFRVVGGERSAMGMEGAGRTGTGPLTIEPPPMTVLVVDGVWLAPPSLMEPIFAELWGGLLC